MEDHKVHKRLLDQLYVVIEICWQIFRFRQKLFLQKLIKYYKHIPNEFYKRQ